MDVLSRIVDWVLAIMEAIGGPGIAIAIAIESIFPPIPSEIVLPLAGFTASQGRYSLVEAILWATAGSLAGALVLYGLGAVVGLRRLRVIADKMPLVKVSDVDKVMDWFERFGPIAILVGRLVPGIRSLISIPAGVERMGMVQFIGFTTLGSVVWNTLLVGAGYLLGDSWDRVERVVDQYSNVVYLLLALALATWVAYLIVRAVRAKRASGAVIAEAAEASEDDRSAEGNPN